MSQLFFSNVASGLTVSGTVEQRLLAEYGAIFAARNVTVPRTIVFRDEDDVYEFQSKLSIASETIGGIRMELQSVAMEDLREAIAEANEMGVSITPRGADSARRTYNETVELWASRVEPALDHWVGKGRLEASEAKRIRALSPFEQVPVVLKLEEDGIYFAKDLSKSIVYSVAPPGTSQHLSMLAFDIRDHDQPDVRAILAKHRWYQTVVSDLPHFTYLGIEEDELLTVGLKRVLTSGRTFWVPDLR